MPTRYLNVNSRDVTLSYLYEVLRTKIEECTAIKLLSNYCFRCISKDIQKKGMEFLYMHGFQKEQELLIEKNLQAEDPEVRHWAEAYRLSNLLREEKSPPKDVLEQLKELTPADRELYCFVEMLKIQVNMKLFNYEPAVNFLNIAEELFAGIDDHLLQQFYQIRYRQILLTYYLARNEIIIARKTAYEIINETKNPYILVDTHKKLGLSYTFDSYYLGMYHLKEALQIAKENDIANEVYKIENHTIPFLAAHFGKTENIKTKDLEEQAHLEIARGNKDKAIQILQSLRSKSPFQLYYLGKAKKDRAILMTAYKQFIHDYSDYFFGRLPLNELKKLADF